MRIFDYVNSKKATLRVAVEDVDQTPVVMPVPEGLKKCSRGAVRIVADDCASWFWKSERDVWDYKEHFGPLRMPFDNLWIEWRVPSRINLGNGNWVHRDRADMSSAVALMTSSDPAPNAPDGTAQTILTTWLFVASGALFGMPTQQWMHVAEDGSYLRHEYAGTDEGMLRLADGMAAGLDPAWLAVGLMNCKNVQVKEEATPPKLARATFKRHGVRPLHYNVISLPGNPTIRSNAQAKQAAGPAAPLHLVRGHFKTYTTESPLLGRHTGTYWWGWQTRGDKSVGEVRKHYEVGPRNGAA